MTITEAHHVNRLVSRIFHIEDWRGDINPTDEKVRESAAYLLERANKALQAGARPEQVREAAFR